MEGVENLFHKLRGVMDEKKFLKNSFFFLTFFSFLSIIRIKIEQTKTKRRKLCTSTEMKKPSPMTF